MAKNTSNNNVTNTDEVKGRKNATTKNIFGLIMKHKVISLVILAVVVIIILSVSDYLNKKKNATEDPNDPKNGPAAANGFINNVYIDENGVLRTEKSIRELWKELKDKGNALTKYLNSPEELAKLLSASMATDYPDTRENPDQPIDWSKYDVSIDSTEVQGIVKFKRALASNDTITMTYLPPSEFQKKINKYNETGKAEDRNEAMKYFTLEKTYDSSATGGYVDISSRSLNNDALEASDKKVDIYEKTNHLFNKRFDAVQSASFDGKYIICSANEGKHGNHGGRVFWIDIETGNVLPNYVTIGSEGNHMTGQTYDCDRKVVLVTSVGNKKLIQIDNVTKQMMSTKYVNIPRYFHVITYSATTKELIGYNNKKLTFMKYDSSKNEYVEQRTVPLSGSFNFALQGMSTDGQVIYFLDSTYGTSELDKFRVWVYDFQGNLIEEHKIGKSFPKTAREVEDCFCDKEGNLWLVMPYEATKVANYKAFPIDWENPPTGISNSSGALNTGATRSNSQVEEILKYACSWVGKISYKFGSGMDLVNGGTSDCSNFIHKVYSHFGLMDKSRKKGFVNSYKWGKGDNGGCPGTVNIGKDISKAAPGDVIFEHYHDKSAHVSIYLGNGKRVECTAYKKKGVIISKVPSKFTAIVRFRALTTDSNAYFDPDTGILHTSSGTSTSTSTSGSSTSSTTTNNSTSTSNSSTSTNTNQVADILKYACSWVGKISWESGANGPLKEGGKTDCGAFVYWVNNKYGLMNKLISPKKWEYGAPGTVEIGKDLSKASPGDITWRKGSDRRCHVSIYLGNGKRVHSTKNNKIGIDNIPQSAVQKIFHFTALPQDPKAYFDPETGIYHSSNGSTSTANNSDYSKSGQAIVDEAEKYIGKLPYVWGGYSLTTGADCSGFCWAILNKLGLYTGEHLWTVPFETKGEEVSSLKDAQAGDMIIYGPEKGKSNHMAIYDGKGGLIHEINESMGCKHYGDAATWGNILTIRRFASSSSAGSVRTYNNNIFNTEKNTIIRTQKNMPIEEGDNRTYRAVQSACFDGKYVICAQNKNYGSREASSKGGRIAWFDMETGKYETSVETSLGGHMDGVAYDSDRNMVLKPVSSGEGNLLQIDNNTKKIVGYAKMSKYCNKLTYVSTLKQLVGLDGGKFIFMSYNSSKNEYVKQKEVKLDSYSMNCGAQGIGTDGQCIYIADSGPNDSSSKYRVWTYTLDGKKVEEHQIGQVHTGSKEVESAFGDNKGNLWLALPRGIEKVLNYTTNASETTEGSNSATNQGSFKVKVATWQENSEKVVSTESSENKEEYNYNMTEMTIPYQSIVAQYRMPFNYLWAMLIYSNNKNYTFELADLVRNSQIEITIHDNYNETITKTTEEKRYNYYYEGQANTEFKYSYTQQVPAGQTAPPSTTQTKKIGNLFTATSESHEDYKKTTTNTNKTNTLDIALTLADTWCVKYEKKYKFNGTDEPNSSTSSQKLDDENGETEEHSTISNSSLKRKILDKAYAAANSWLSGQPNPGTIKDVSIIQNENQKQTDRYTITNQKITTKVTTTSSSYTAEPEKYYTEETPKFAIVFNKNFDAKSNILSAKEWLFEALESNADTVNMVDLTKYLMYKATGNEIDGVTDFFAVFEKLKQNYIDISQGEMGETGGTSGISGNEGKVYDFLLSKGVPAVGAAAVMGNIENESNFSTTVVNSIGASGLCQWYQGRANALKEFAKTKNTNWTDLNTQLEFMWRELETNYTKVKNIIMSATAEKDLEYATWYWGSYYETYDSANQVGYQASRQWKEEQERYTAAQKWYNSWKQKHTTGGGSSSVKDTPTDISQAILSKANAKSTPWPGTNMCLKWVDDVYSNAGISPDRKSTAFLAWKAHGISTDKNNIPIGAAVYGTGQASSGAGHVGIYIGNGKVIDSVSKGINTSTLEQWISWQTDTIEGHQGWLGWGWEDGNRTRGLN